MVCKLFMDTFGKLLVIVNHFIRNKVKSQTIDFI